MEADPSIRARLEKEIAAEPTPILVRKGPGGGGRPRVLFGMRPFVQAILDGKTEIEVFTPINEDDVRPLCEPHVVYDLIKAYERRGHDEAGFQQLIGGLTLLNREYANVEKLLRERFDPVARNMPDNGVERAIQAVFDN